MNPDDIRFVGHSGDSVVFSFSLRKPILPWKIKHISGFTGLMYLQNGELKKLSLNSVKKFRSAGIRYERYTVSAFFKGNREDGYLLDYYQTNASGMKKGKRYSYSENLNILTYQDKEKNTLADFSPVVMESGQMNSKADTFKIKLERSLPFLGNSARKAGYELPLPWGFNLFSHFQKESYNLNDIVLNGINLFSIFTRLMAH